MRSERAASPTQPGSDLYRLLVDRVQDYAIFALNPSGHILSWNAGAVRLKGYTAEEIIGRHFSIFYPPEDLAAGKPDRELEVALANGQVEDEGWRLRKDGTRFWANVLITTLRDDQGTLIGFAKVTRDLTERRRAEETLRESEERFRLLVASVRDYAIFMLDPTGIVATWNDGAERINGYPAAEIIGRHFSIFYTPEDLAAGKPARELEIATRTGSYEEEGWRLRKDGTRFWTNVVITAVIGPSGALAGFAKVTRELTAQRAAQEQAIADARRLAAEEAARTTAELQAVLLRGLVDQLRTKTHELEHRTREAEGANRAKAEFLAAMSHELRTPLNAIGGYAQLLALEVSGALLPTQREHVDRIHRSQVHLLGIINDILNFSRIAAGQVSYDLTSFAINHAVESVIPMIIPQAQSKGIDVRAGGCANDLTVYADRVKVEQILLNLLSNSVKFTPAGGSIDLLCGRDARGVCVAVRDSGIGIPPDQLTRVFEPFVQVGRTLVTPSEGTGLGLSISRDLARAMKGDLEAQSVEGQGSTFTLRLPQPAVASTD